MYILGCLRIESRDKARGVSMAEKLHKCPDARKCSLSSPWLDLGLLELLGFPAAHDRIPRADIFSAEPLFATFDLAPSSSLYLSTLSTSLVDTSTTFVAQTVLPPALPRWVSSPEKKSRMPSFRTVIHVSMISPSLQRDKPEGQTPRLTASNTHISRLQPADRDARKRRGRALQPGHASPREVLQRGWLGLFPVVQ